MATLRLGGAKAAVAIEHVRRRHELDSTLEIAPGEPASGRLRITFETPAWLTLKERLHAADDVDFRALFHHVYRRLPTLAALYGELRPEDDARFPEIDRLAAPVRTASAGLRAVRWERHSWEREVRHPMMGLVGTLLFERPIGVFRPVLEAAAITLVGKRTSHGLGWIHVEGPADSGVKEAHSTHEIGDGWTSPTPARLAIAARGTRMAHGLAGHAPRMSMRDGNRAAGSIIVVERRPPSLRALPRLEGSLAPGRSSRPAGFVPATSTSLLTSGGSSATSARVRGSTQVGSARRRTSAGSGRTAVRSGRLRGQEAQPCKIVVSESRKRSAPTRIMPH